MKFPLVTVQWLSKHLENENLFVLDASMEKVVGREPLVYEHFCCIPGARRFDLETVFTNPLSVQQFANQVNKLGPNDDSVVVIYDNQGIYSAPRAWWMFKTMGFDAVYVLNGGLPQWQREKHPTAEAYESEQTGHLEVSCQPELISSAKDVVKNLNDPLVKIIDARSKARFLGLAPEPRPGVRAGHIPGSVNIPFTDVLDGPQFKIPAELKLLFRDRIGDSPQRLIFSCGSGVTACVVLLAAWLAGYRNLSLYDGSWAEWGRDKQLPVTVPGGQPK